MMQQIRSSVFETNSSSSHSLTLGEAGLRDFSLAADALKTGVMHVNIDRHFGWGWERLFRPESKIAYLISQVASSALYEADGRRDQKGILCKNSRVRELIDIVEKTTRCKIEISVKSEHQMYGIDHQSNGVGLDLLKNREKLLDFLFSAEAYVQIGNDNNAPPAMISTDLGRKVPMFPGQFTDRAPEGEDVTLLLQNDGRDATALIGEDMVTGTARFCALRSLGTSISGFTITEIYLVLYKPAEFKTIRFSEELQTYTDGSEKWEDPAYLDAKCQDTIHTMISRMGGGVAVTQGLKISYRIETDSVSEYLGTAPLVTFKGRMSPASVEDLKNGFYELGSDPGMSP